jgi:hypothetical protein
LIGTKNPAGKRKEHERHGDIDCGRLGVDPRPGGYKVMNGREAIKVLIEL